MLALSFIMGFNKLDTLHDVVDVNLKHFLILNFEFGMNNCDFYIIILRMKSSFKLCKYCHIKTKILKLQVKQ